MFEFFRQEKLDGRRPYAINPVSLSFLDHELEVDFRSAYFSSNLQFGRVVHLLAIFFYCSVGLWDAMVTSPARMEYWSWVLPVVVSIFLAGLLFSYRSIELYARYWQHLFAFYVIVTGTGFTTVTVLSGPDYPEYNFVGIVFCLIFCYTFIRLTYLWATVAGCLIVVLYSLATVFMLRSPEHLLISSIFYMVAINFLCMMVCYSLELMFRRNFVLTDLLEAERKKTWETNRRLEENVAMRTTALHESNVKLKRAVEREKKLVRKLQEEEAGLQKSIEALEQAETIARLGYFEGGWQDGKAYWSKGLLALLGMKDKGASLTRRQFIERIHEEDRTRVMTGLQRGVEEHCPVDLEFRLWTENGEIIFVHGLAQTIYEHDRPQVTRGVILDITERMQASAELERLQGELVQAQKMESVGRLAGGVAHDYNNISTVIVGYSELLLESLEPGEPHYDEIRQIHESALKSTEITRQLLAFARKQTIAPRAVDMSVLLANSTTMLQRLVGEDIEISFQHKEHIWPILMDPSQIDQIMANLCVNARDAISDVGRIRIRVENTSLDEHYCSLHAGAVPGEYVCLSVKDDGAGIEPELLDKIFDPFFTTKSVDKGTGLGLATIYGVVKQNDGYIDVESEVGSGTTFTIYLPRHLGEIDDSASPKITETGEGQGEFILLAEDDPSIIKMSTAMLRSLGYEVLPAAGPIEAIEIAEKFGGTIDLLITDVIMPEMNGRELSETLEVRYPEMKTLFVSGYTSDVITRRGILDEGVQFLAKPFSKARLADKIRTILEDR